MKPWRASIGLGEKKLQPTKLTTVKWKIRLRPATKLWKVLLSLILMLTRLQSLYSTVTQSRVIFLLPSSFFLSDCRIIFKQWPIKKKTEKERSFDLKNDSWIVLYFLSTKINCKYHLLHTVWCVWKLQRFNRLGSYRISFSITSLWFCANCWLWGTSVAPPWLVHLAALSIFMSFCEDPQGCSFYSKHWPPL